jgi:hypothetical protein
MKFCVDVNRHKEIIHREGHLCHPAAASQTLQTQHIYQADNRKQHSPAWPTLVLARQA